MLKCIHSLRLLCRIGAADRESPAEESGQWSLLGAYPRLRAEAAGACQWAVETDGAQTTDLFARESVRLPVMGLRLVRICTHPDTQGHAGLFRRMGPSPCRSQPLSLHIGCSPRAWTTSRTAAQIRLPAPHPSSSHPGSSRQWENTSASVRLQSLTHYFYFNCCQAIVKIPTHQHIRHCKLSCPQPPLKKQLTPSSLQRAILNLLLKDRREEKGTVSF